VLAKESPVGNDPEELAATLRELARLDPVELGLEVVLERIVQAAATGWGSSGVVGLLLLGPDGQLRYVVAAGRPDAPWPAPGPARRRPLGGRVRAGRAGLQQRPCRRAALARLPPANATFLNVGIGGVPV
jgi:hypothetical protein